MPYDQPIGQSFAPFGNPTQQPLGGPDGSNAVGQAIKTLNLRYPRVVGAGSVAPSALLNSPGSAGLMGDYNPTLAAILQAVLGRGTPPQQSAPSAPGGLGPSGPQIPPPRIIPIAPPSGPVTTQPGSTPVAPTAPRTPPDAPRVPPGRPRVGNLTGGGFQAGSGIRY